MSDWVLDTNTLLRFLLNDIPEQVKEVEKKIEQAKNGKIRLHVPQIVVFEIHFALVSQYGFDKQAVIDALKKIIILDYLVVSDREIFMEAMELYKEKNVSLPDCFIKIYAEHYQAGIFTFDKDLLKLHKS